MTNLFLNRFCQYALFKFLRFSKNLALYFYPPLRVEYTTYTSKFNEFLPVPLFPAPQVSLSKSKVSILVGYHNPSLALFQLPYIVALVKSGFTIHCLLPSSNLPARDFYLKAGVSTIISYNDIFVDTSSVKTLFQAFLRFPNPTLFTFKSIPLGKFVVSSLMRHTRIGNLKKLLANKCITYKFFKNSYIAAVRAHKIIDKFNPTLICLYDKGYTPEGELAEAAIFRGINVSTINTAHKSGHIIGKIYDKNNSNVHFSKPTDSFWRYLRLMKFSDSHRSTLISEITNSYNNNSWYDEVGTQVNTRYFDKVYLFERLGLSSNKPCAVIFPHLFWDATFFWGEDLFDDYSDWFENVIKVAAEKTDVNWIIKIHPSNVTKNIRDRYSGEFSEVLLLKRLFKKIPSHIVILYPSTNISTLSLYSIMDYCLTVRGTVGIEAALFGKTVITAGTGRYDNLGFTIDSKSRSEYLTKLLNITDLPLMLDSQVELAQRYAYGLFILRCIQINSITFKYSKDSSAAIQIYNNLTPENLSSFDDIKLLSAWYQSLSDELVNSPSV